MLSYITFLSECQGIVWKDGLLYRIPNNGNPPELYTPGGGVETDPVFSASPAGGITTTQKTHWDTAYSWGNHASAGYLTTESDTLHSITTRGNTTSNSISVGLITGTSGVSQFKFNAGAANETPVIAVGNLNSTGKFAALLAGTSGSEFNFDNSGWFAIAGDNKFNYTSNNLGSGSETYYLRIQGSTGNVQINTATDAGYKFDVNGTGRFQNDLTAAGKLFMGVTSGSYRVTIQSANNDVLSSSIYLNNTSGGTAGASYLSLGAVGSSGYLAIYGNAYSSTSIAGRLVLGLNSNATGLSFSANGTATQDFRFFVQSGEVLRLSAAQNVLIGTTVDSAKLAVTGTITASTSIARGIYFGPTLVAAANNDVLVGLDINPTFTNGAFTGVSNIGLRVNGQIINRDGTNTGVLITSNANAVNGGSIYQYTIANTKYSTISFYNSSNALSASFGYGDSLVNETNLRDSFLVGARTSSGKLIFVRGASATQSMTMFSTGNLLIQDGGTHTDAGYKLNVNGNIALSGNLVPTSGTSSVGTFANRFTDFWGSGLIVGTTFYGDSHQSASGTLYFKDGGGTEKMRMTSGGNFLIGTGVDAGYKLNVNGTVKAGITRLGYVSTYTDSNAALYVGNAVSGSNSAKLIIDPYEANDLYYKLVLESTFYAAQPFQLYSSNVQTWLYGYASGMLYQPHAMKIPTQISMGTTSVASNEISGSVLFIHGENYYAQPAFIRMTSYSTGIANTRGVVMGLWTGDNLRFWNYENTAINIGTNNVERITVLGNGNVGISNTSPAYKLDVVGDINTSTGFRVGGAAGWTGTINIVGNPPGQQNIQVQGGIITNFF